MTKLKLLLCAGSAGVGLLLAGSALADDQPAGGSAAAPAAPQPTPMPYPSVAGPLVANGSPATFDAGPIGKVMVDGVVSGFALWQSHPAFDAFGNHNKDFYGDFSNAQIILNKTDGPIQFYLQVGAYDLPSLGTPYYKAKTITDNTYGYAPQGFIKLVPNSNLNVMVGALPTLIGDEYTFSFENYDIQRGLLWNQEPAVSKGVQVNYTNGPWAISGAVTDGYYSDTYTALSGLITYTFKNTDALTFAAEGNAGTARTATFATPVQQNNGQIYNLIFTHNMGPLTISPYLQYNSSPNIPGVSFSGDTIGFAVLAKYQFNPHWSLAGRVEYIKSHGAANLLGYGVDSDAWSITVTPTYQQGIFFVRGEFSYTGVGGGTPGLMFGTFGTDDTQARLLAEAGVMF
ncbi:MAG TPA: outer membrane beta-barrel protein [Caulobacteraceae bacterium]|nr:outer membrane beta-barrel protein [Caulobacteraceae bacterium]